MQTSTAAPAVVASEPSVESYELGPGDVVRIHFKQKADFNGDYRVRADGHLTLPLIDNLLAQGKLENELNRDIGAAMAAVGVEPPLLVEVIERRPLYVIGFVNKPGSIPHQRDMKVGDAIRMAGGLLSAPVMDTSNERFASVATEIGKLERAQSTLQELLAHRTRLSAELEHRNVPVISKAIGSLDSTAQADELASQETQLWMARTAEVSRRQRDKFELIARTRGELDGLKVKLARTTDQLRAAKLRISTLSKKASSKRSLSLAELEASAAVFEASLLAIRTAITRAELVLEKAQIARAVDIERQLVIHRNIGQTDRQIATTEKEICTTKLIIEQVTAIPLGSIEVNQSTQPVYAIIRHADERTLYIDADEASAVWPDDILRVSLSAGETRNLTSCSPRNK